MSEENNQQSPASQSSAADEYQSVNREQIEAARAAGNTWLYKEREMEMYVAQGYVEISTEILNSGEPTGAVMIHQFGWDRETAFVKHERSFKTSLVRVGRSARQKVKTTQAVPPNAALYADLIQGGIIRRMENGEPVDQVKTREQMLDFARFYPESASEAVETWFESARFKILEENESNNFDWMFTNLPVKKVLFYIGEEENPLAAGILTFNSPSKEEREKFDEEVQNIESEKKGDLNFAELSENFGKKIQYGSKHLAEVEGIAVGAEGVKFNAEMKQKFITLFNPIWFVEAVETMHDSFVFTKGKSARS